MAGTKISDATLTTPVTTDMIPFERVADATARHMTVLALFDRAIVFNESGADVDYRFEASGAANALFIQGSDGNIGIGTATPNRCLTVMGDATNTVADFINDGNSNDRYGIRIKCGKDDATGVNYLVELEDGDGTDQGYIQFTEGTVAYGTFTANHDVYLPKAADKKGYPYGSVVIIEHTFKHKASKMKRKVYYMAALSTASYDQRVFGVYAGRHNDNYSDNALDRTDKLGNLHMIYVIGDGHIRVCEQGGNIKIGDYLTTSDVEGHAMKQDSGQLNNYTIAKATEKVDWANYGNDRKLISCTYHSA